MDTHHRAAAILHIVTSVLALCIILVFVLAVGGAAVFGREAGVPGFMFGIGTVFLGVLAVPVLANLIAAIAFLKGSANARIVLIVFAVLGLPAFPWGTLIGAYTLWALLRKLPPAGLSADLQAPAAFPAAGAVDLTKS